MKKRIDRGQQGQASIWITVILVIVGGYFLLAYLPPWYKSTQISGIVGEVISGTNEYDEEKLRDTIAHNLNEIGVDVADGDIVVEVYKESKRVEVIVKWPAIIKFPLSRKTSKVNFTVKVKRKTG